MNQKEKAVVGYDSDDGFAGLAIAVVIIIIAVTIAIYGGIFIGGFYSLKNYFVSFKRHVIDENLKKIAV